MLGACNIDTSGEPALRDKLKQYVVLQYRKFKVRPAPPYCACVGTDTVLGWAVKLCWCVGAGTCSMRDER